MWIPYKYLITNDLDIDATLNLQKKKKIQKIVLRPRIFQDLRNWKQQKCYLKNENDTHK